jgi:hypothetical protein
MAPSLDDLIGIRQHPEIARRFGILHTAELLVLTQPAVSCDRPRETMKSGQWVATAAYWLRGKLPDGNEVKTARFYVPVGLDLPDKTDDERGQAFKRALDDLALKAPNPNDAVCVYWFSEPGKLPAPFKNNRGESDIYVHMIPDLNAEDLPLFRRRSAENCQPVTENYKATLEASLPELQKSRKEQEREAKKSYKNMARDEVRKALNAKPRYSPAQIDAMQEQSLEKYLCAVLNDDVVNTLRANKRFVRDYESALRRIAYFHPNEIIERLCRVKGEQILQPYSLENAEETVKWYKSELNQLLHNMFLIKRNTEQEGSAALCPQTSNEDILYQMQAAIDSAISHVFHVSVPVTMRGCFGSSSRKANAYKQPRARS